MKSSIDANLCLPLSWICSTLTETRQKACGLVVSFRSLSGLTSCRPSANPLTLTEVNLTGRGTKSVILNLFQDLSFPQSIPHPSPLLLRRGNSIIVRSTVTDSSLFTIHYSLILMQTSCLPPPSFPPLTEVNLTVEGSVVKLLRFIQKPPCKRCLKFFEYLIQAVFQSEEIILMQTYVCQRKVRKRSF